MITDPISDYLTRIRNAVRVKHSEVIIPHSNLKEKISDILVNNKFLKNFEVISEGKKKFLKVELLYKDKNKKSVINEIKRISKPGRRVYIKGREIKPVLRGYGLGIFSTNQGLLTDSEARERKVGGEFILTIW